MVEEAETRIEIEIDPIRMLCRGGIKLKRTQRYRSFWSTLDMKGKIKAGKPYTKTIARLLSVGPTMYAFSNEPYGLMDPFSV